MVKKSTKKSSKKRKPSAKQLAALAKGRKKRAAKKRKASPACSTAGTGLQGCKKGDRSKIECAVDGLMLAECKPKRRKKKAAKKKASKKAAAKKRIRKAVKTVGARVSKNLAKATRARGRGVSSKNEKQAVREFMRAHQTVLEFGAGLRD